MWPSARSLSLIGLPGVKAVRALAALAFVAGCAAVEDRAPVRHPDFRPAAIRRPAVVLQVKGEIDERDEASLPRQLEARLIDDLNRQGFFPLEVTLLAPAARPDRGQALGRARSLGADVLLAVELEFQRRTLLYCVETRRPVRAASTVVAVTVEVLRVGDGTRLLLSPPDTGEPVTDVEVQCGRERAARRRSLEELADLAIARALAPLTGR